MCVRTRYHRHPLLSLSLSLPLIPPFPIHTVSPKPAPLACVRVHLECVEANPVCTCHGALDACKGEFLCTFEGHPPSDGRATEREGRETRGWHVRRALSFFFFFPPFFSSVYFD